jgi:hypothetical protein
MAAALRWQRRRDGGADTYTAELSQRSMKAEYIAPD